MVIYGIAKNQIGRKFFMVKNSWGEALLTILLGGFDFGYISRVDELIQQALSYLRSSDRSSEPGRMPFVSISSTSGRTAIRHG